MTDEFDDIELDDDIEFEEEESERTAIQASILVNILGYLDDSEELKKIFGTPVSDGLVVVADEDDLRIESGMTELTDKQSETFLEILKDAIEKHTPDDDTASGGSKDA